MRSANGIQNNEAWRTAYQAVATRRSNSDELRWQMPAFGVAAEALLINAAIQVLNRENQLSIAALAIGLAGAVVGLYITWLMYEHSRFERIDALMLRELEWALLRGKPDPDKVHPSPLHDGLVLPYDRGGVRATVYSPYEEMKFKEVFYWWSPQFAWAVLIGALGLTAGGWIALASWSDAFQETEVGAILLVLGATALSVPLMNRALQTVRQREAGRTRAGSQEGKDRTPRGHPLSFSDSNERTADSGAVTPQPTNSLGDGARRESTREENLGSRNLGWKGAVIITLLSAILGGLAGAWFTSLLDRTPQKLEGLALTVRRQNYGTVASLLIQFFPDDAELARAKQLVEVANQAFDDGAFDQAADNFEQARAPMRQRCQDLQDDPTIISENLLGAVPVDVLGLCGSIEMNPSGELDFDA